jgi:hypothetical protein
MTKYIPFALYVQLNNILTPGFSVTSGSRAVGICLEQIMVKDIKIKKIQFVFFLLSLFSIVTGFLIYYFFRENNILIYKWFEFLPKNNSIIIFSDKHFWLDFFRYNLPDGLLVLSGLLFLKSLWYEKRETFLVYKICFLFAVFLFEILQIFDGISGTFDFFDLLTMGSIILLESIVHKILMIRRRSCVKK